MRIEVLRLGHRPERDKRVTTHVCLTARAMGAGAVHIAEEDVSIVKTLTSVARRFGGKFDVTSGQGWKGPLQRWQKAGGQVVHLTMYGLPLSESVPAVVADGRDVLIVIGAEKVPADLYDLADHNVAVGNQPHSEVAALALLLDRLRDGAWEWDAFPGGSLRIVPSEHGKRVEGDDPQKADDTELD